MSMILEGHTLEWVLGVLGAIVISLLTWLGSRIYTYLSNNRSWFNSRIGANDVKAALETYTLITLDPVKDQITDLNKELAVTKSQIENVKTNTYSRDYVDGQFLVAKTEINSTKEAVSELKQDLKRVEANMSARFDKLTEDIHEVTTDVKATVVHEIRNMMRQRED